MPYFDGGRSKANRPVGVYGSARVVEAVHAAGALYTWQTCAWSGGVVSPVAHVYQRLHPTVPTPIPGTDENALIKEVPLWTAAPAPKPTPVNVGVNVKLIDLSNANTTPVKGPGVKPLQRLLCVKDDGAAGPRTRAALIAAQQRLKLTPDAKFGPTTATALLAEK